MYTVNCSSFHYHISLQNVWARSQGSLQNQKLRVTQVARGMNEEVVRNNHHGFSPEIWWLTSLIILKNENTGEREFLCLDSIKTFSSVPMHPSSQTDAR